MDNQPEVQLGQEISVSNNMAIVCGIYTHTKEIQVVYLQHGTKPIAENAHWKDGQWQFVHAGPVGDYADRLPHLKPYVDKLREYHHHKKPTAPKKPPRRGGGGSLVSHRRLVRM